MHMPEMWQIESGSSFHMLRKSNLRKQTTKKQTGGPTRCRDFHTYVKKRNGKQQSESTLHNFFLVGTLMAFVQTGVVFGEAEQGMVDVRIIVMTSATFW